MYTSFKKSWITQQEESQHCGYTTGSATKDWCSMDVNPAVKHLVLSLTFRHRTSCILGQVFHYSPENDFYIFNQQIYFII